MENLEFNTKAYEFLQERAKYELSVDVGKYSKEILSFLVRHNNRVFDTMNVRCATALEDIVLQLNEKIYILEEYKRLDTDYLMELLDYVKIENVVKLIYNSDDFNPYYDYHTVDGDTDKILSFATEFDYYRYLTDDAAVILDELKYFLEGKDNNEDEVHFLLLMYLDIVWWWAKEGRGVTLDEVLAESYS